MTNVAEAINNQTVNGPTLKTGLDTQLPNIPTSGIHHNHVTHNQRSG